MSTTEDLTPTQSPTSSPSSNDAVATAAVSPQPVNSAGTPPSKVSFQMRSVITILAADPGLFDIVSPFINYAENSVDWERLFSLVLSSGHKSVINWAYICWRDQVPEGTNPFESIFNCDPLFRRAIAKALAVRWGVAK